MLSSILRKIILTIPLLLLVSIIMFTVINMLPGNAGKCALPVRMFLLSDRSCTSLSLSGTAHHLQCSTYVADGLPGSA